MSKIVRSPSATSDLRQVVDYISLDSPAAADRWLEDIGQLFELLASQPLIGQLHKLGSRRVRRHCYGNYVIYYRPIRAGIEIARVIHAAAIRKRPFNSLPGSNRRS